MAHNNIEIEIQVTVEDPKPLMEFLKKSGDFQSEKHQVDEYFSPAHRDFISVRPTTEWLRLRDANKEYFISYKNWHFDKDGKNQCYCDEFETRVESIDRMRKIFSVLDFKPVVIVDKLRKIWTYKNYEIAIDAVKNLGDFVEIEYIGKDEKADPEKVSKEMIDFLKKIGCGKIMKNEVGYPFLLLFPKEAKYEAQ
ncbi:MAG: class IV adenylate cyclase [Patescibacteria group bacterium]|nr:class IV adenylate cyclase [Patescibacteria group bacterium]